MALTKIGKATVIGAGVIVVGAFAAAQFQNTQEIVKLQNQKPVVVTKTVIVTPTLVPTATPSATRIFTPARVTKGVK